MGAILFGLLRSGVGLIPGVGPFLAMVPAGGWKIIGSALGIGIAVLFIYQAGINKANARCDAAALRAQLRVTEIDKAALKEQVERSTIAASELEKGKADADARASALALELSKRPTADRCALTRDRANRLR